MKQRKRNRKYLSTCLRVRWSTFMHILTNEITFFSQCQPSRNASYVAFVFTSDDDLYGGEYDRRFPSSLKTSHHCILRFVVANKVQHSKYPAMISIPWHKEKRSISTLFTYFDWLIKKKLLYQMTDCLFGDTSTANQEIDNLQYGLQREQV